MNDATDPNDTTTEPAGPKAAPVSEPAPARGRTGRKTGRIRAVLRWWPLPVFAATGAICGTAYGLLAPPQYAATSYVVAVPAKDAQPGAAVGFAQAYGRIATGDSTMAYARVAAGMPADRLRSRVRTETSPDSPMIAITGTSNRPGEAADIANAVADAVFVSSNQVAKSTGVRLVSFSQAIPPTRRVSPSAPIAGAVGGCAGGLIGGLVLLVRPRPARRTAAATVPAPAGPQEATGAGQYAAEMERV
ncbi:lipopolysaccharide biosynthesis protein [Streptomyces sp. NPDC004609]|uniref:lipopolysaccharide biosynthesis protein n=1 Tax=Streptomyces sp. NPDC004609 TaxID=3364704 RepID=UPI0036C0F913